MIRKWSRGRVAGVLVLILATYGAALGLSGTFEFDRPAAAQSGLKQQPAAPGPETGHVPGRTIGNTSDAEFWRQIRQGAPGTVTIPQSELGVLIQSKGEEWRSIRNGPVSLYGSSLLLGVIAVAALYFVIRGRIRIEGGRTGRHILRFTLTQRVIHWFAAVLFVLLGVTGVILLFGKHVLIPVIGPAAYAVVASGAMQAHNLFGPLFIVSIVLLFIGFVRGNGFVLADLRWFARLGGLFGGHASSGRYNAGEKSWFWVAIVTGLALSVTGVVLDFPFLSDRAGLQLANMIHGVAAVVFIVFGLGHIYLGTVGMEGAFESMSHGEVDENWAKEHHDHWYEEMTAAGGEATPGTTAEASK